MLHIGRSRSDVVQGRDKVVQLFTYYLKDIPHIQWHLRKFIKWSNSQETKIEKPIIYKYIERDHQIRSFQIFPR
ncbi:unnamed protein product [Rhizophagus irregularis]|nr:unnamed protein product [Rhizophagus irregularis]